jgi:hypothetical protein
MRRVPVKWLLVAGLLSGAAIVAPVAAVAAGQTATVNGANPATLPHFVGKLAVVVRGSGFTPGQNIALIECNKNFQGNSLTTGTQFCGTPGGGYTFTTATAKGNIRVDKFEVDRGMIGTGASAARCNHLNSPCFIVVTNDDNVSETTKVPITFTAPPKG